MNLSTPEEMLRLYGVAAALSADILEQARQEDWDGVANLGQRYVETIERVKTLGELPPLDALERARKHALIVEILENDSATRALVEPGLARLGALLGNLRRQQSLVNAYGTTAVAVS